MVGYERIRRRTNFGKIRDWLYAFGQVLSLVPKRRVGVVVGGLFFAGLLELIGLTMIIPLLASAAHLRESKGGIVTALRTMMEWFGLSFTQETVLVFVFVGLSLKAVVSICVTRYVSNIVGDISRDFQLALIRSLLRVRWSFFIRQRLGRMIHATGAEAVAIGECFQNVTSIIATFIQSLLFIGLAAAISWPLALLAVSIGVFIFVSFGRLVHHSREAARQHRRQMRRHAGKFSDAMLGIKQVRAMGRTAHFSRLFEDDAIAMSNTLRTRVLSAEYAGELQEPVIGCILATGFFIALHTLDMPLNNVLIMALLLVRAIAALAPIQRQMQRFILAYDQYQSLLNFLGETSRAAESSGGNPPPTLRRGITFERVTFGYEEKAVLSDVDLEIPWGSITCLAGPSGAGKSTVVDLIVGLHSPSTGRILIDAVDLATVNLEDWRTHVGYVPQETVLFHDSIFRNVALWDESVSEAQVEEALRAAGAWSFVEEMPEGIETVIAERGHRLSGGQRQRISIARALLHSPSLLILDEATSGLDPQTEQAICEQIHKLARAQGLTVLAVSHQPAWQRIADRRYSIRHGSASLDHAQRLCYTKADTLHSSG